MTSPDDALVEPSIAAEAAAGPPPVEDVPEPQAPPQQAETGEPASFREFDPKHREPFNGLLFLGYLEDSFEIWGHQFRIATPTQAERMQMGVLHKEYAGSLASEIAYQTLMVASYLREVDFQDLPQPVTNSQRENAVRDRFRWVGENLRGPVIDEVFSRCMLLEAQVREVLKAMGEARG